MTVALTAVELSSIATSVNTFCEGGLAIRSQALQGMVEAADLLTTEDLVLLAHTLDKYQSASDLKQKRHC